MIELRNICKIFNQDRSNELRAIDCVDLTIEKGRITVFKGPSGSGKTTLLTLIGCLARPTSGRIRLQERDISGLPERFLTEIRRSTFGFVFQSFNLIRGLTAVDNVMLPAYPLGIGADTLRTRANDLMEMLRIEGRADTRVEHLSGGEAQRVAIARALINDPPIIIADEPTANLDTTLSREFLGILGDLKDAGKTLLVTSHDPLIWDDAGVDRVVTMRDGRLVDEG